MKLIFAIVNNDDGHSVSSALMKSGFFATKLASTGGFLMSGNTTFMMCVDDDKVDVVIEVISNKSRKRQQLVPAANVGGIEMQGASYPVEVSVGGATVFVTDVERYEKL